MVDDKYKSRKFGFAVWAAATFTILGIIALFNDTNPSWMTSSLPILAGIVVAYIPVQGIIDKGKGNGKT